MSNSCKICGNDHHNKSHIIKEMMFGTRHSFEYLECGGCGAIQLIDPPDDLSVYYPDNYYAYTSLNESGNLRKLLKKIRWKLFSRWDIKLFRPLYGAWLKNTGVGLEDKIADIGCGNGQLLYEMYASGFKNLIGIDPFIENNQSINASLSLYKKSIFEIKEEFDFIMMHHSFEHMDEPKRVLERISRLLKPGKMLLIRIPVSDGKAWELYGVNWVQLDAPRHIYIHSIKSVKLLAEQTGFEVSRIIFDSDSFQFWASEAILQDISPADAQGLFTKKELKYFDKKAAKFNQAGKGDQACFYLTKQ